MGPTYIIASLLTDIITHLLHNASKIRRFHQQTAANRTVHVDLQEWREETFDMSRELLRPVLEPNLLSHFIAEKALRKSCFVYFAVS